MEQDDIYSNEELELLSLMKKRWDNSLDTFSSYGSRLVSTLTLLQTIFFAVLAFFKEEIRTENFTVRLYLFAVPVLWSVSIIFSMKLMILGVRNFYWEPKTIKEILDKEIQRASRSLRSSFSFIYAGLIIALLALVQLFFF